MFVTPTSATLFLKSTKYRACAPQHEHHLNEKVTNVKCLPNYIHFQNCEYLKYNFCSSLLLIPGGNSGILSIFNKYYDSRQPLMPTQTCFVFLKDFPWVLESFKSIFQVICKHPTHTASGFPQLKQKFSTFGKHTYSSAPSNIPPLGGETQKRSKITQNMHNVM